MYRFVPVMILCLLSGIRSADAAESLSVYSNICFHDESGDILGIRVAILNLGDAPYVFVQWAEGELTGPEVYKLSSGDFGKGKIDFPVRGGQSPARFSGTITEKGIVGAIDDKSLMKDFGWKVIQLRRVPVSQKSYQSCR